MDALLIVLAFVSSAGLAIAGAYLSLSILLLGMQRRVALPPTVSTADYFDRALADEASPATNAIAGRI